MELESVETVDRYVPIDDAGDERIVGGRARAGLVRARTMVMPIVIARENRSQSTQTTM